MSWLSITAIVAAIVVTVLGILFLLIVAVLSIGANKALVRHVQKLQIELLGEKAKPREVLVKLHGLHVNEKYGAALVCVSGDGRLTASEDTDIRWFSQDPVHLLGAPLYDKVTSRIRDGKIQVVMLGVVYEGEAPR